jgi:diacylglycerol kinase family enzyme
MKTVALYNPAAGSVTADGGEKLSEALAEAGVRQVELVEIDRTDCKNQIKRLTETNPDLFIVWGGDGTLRSALGFAGQSIANLLLLPGGTMNLLTKSIHGDKTWQAILKEVIASPKRTVIPAGKVNDEIFYCAMLAGAPARLAEARESLRRGELVKAAVEARAALETLGALHLDARYRDGYTFERATLPTTSVIGVLVGPLAQDAEMEVATLTDPSAGGALSVMWSSFVSDWRSSPGVTIAPARSLVIESEDGDIPVIVDGEAIDAGDTVRVSYVKEAAQCLTAG